VQGHLDITIDGEMACDIVTLLVNKILDAQGEVQSHKKYMFELVCCLLRHM
jgi:hypothetical protein